MPPNLEAIDQALIRLEDVYKDYRCGHRVVQALRGVSLSVQRGSFVVIEGLSGSGKSTLLNLIGCLDYPTRGRVIIAGWDASTMNDRALSRFRAERLGFIFQGFNLIPVLSAYENVEYPLRLKGGTRAYVRQRTEAALAAVGLIDMADQRPSELSGGQCQRVAIARALVSQPDLIVADEPTANLDSHTGERIVELMRSMVERFGATFIIATHDPMIACHATHRFRLRDGQMVFE